jgi:hypothetical protein
LVSVVGALGCPQLLDDGFETRYLSDPDAGPLCLAGDCGLPRSGAAGASPGGSAGASGAGGAPGGGSAGASSAAGSAGSAGDAATGGVGSAGDSGTGGVGAAGAGSGSSGAAGTGGADSGPACWTLELTDPTHDSASNCLGIYGWNQIERDPQDGQTTVALSYQNGDPCFTGTVDSLGWGATYTLTFADDTAWNASSAGVTGFDFLYRGAKQPASLRVIYKDDSSTDFCRVIGAGETAVPFSAGHPNCSTSASSGTVTVTKLRELILAFPVNNQPYDVDFCVQLRALQ